MVDESGSDYFFFSTKSYELKPLGYLYRPHLRAYWFTASFLVLIAFIGWLGGQTADRDLRAERALEANNRGLVASEDGRLEDALLCFDSAVILDSTNSVYFYNRGLTNFQLGHDSAALGDYSTYLQSSPDDIDALYARAELYADIGEMELAKHDCSVALSIAPDNFDVLSAYGFTLIAGDQYDSALVVLNKATRLFPQMAHGYTLRAYAHYYAGAYSRARADIDSAQRLGESSPSVLHLKGRVFDDLGNTDSAIFYFSHALEDTTQLAEWEIVYARERLDE